MNTKDLKSKTLPQLKKITESLNAKPYLAKYIFNFIHAKQTKNINEITPLSKSLRKNLSDRGFYISTLLPVEKFSDPDRTVKYLFKLPEGEKIESVLLNDKNRKTVCISTQAGCPLNCTFCATGKLPFKRNLTPAEIIDQLYLIEYDAGPVNNVVYMGMGEPFLNYDNLIASINILNHPDARNIGIRRMTVSTCGLPEEIIRFAELNPPPRLAISLHAPDNRTREILMPVNKKYPLEKLIPAVKNYQLKTRNRVTFEYIMIKNLNDTKKHSTGLISLLKEIKCNINLIEYNPHTAGEYLPSSHNAINRFAEDLQAAGLETVIRYKRGQTIKAACGQLGTDAYKKTP